MQLHKLRSFIAVAEALSIRGAAKRLGIAQSALTKQIAGLETDLGLDLLVRDRQRVVGLTPAGETFLEDARRILAEVERATRSARGIAEGKEGRLRLGVCEDATTERLSRILAAFHRALPKVQVDLFEMPSPRLACALRRNDIDLALLVAPATEESLIVDPLWEDNWLIALPSDHTLVGRNRIACGDLSDVPVILAHPELGPTGHDRIKEAFRAAEITPIISAFALRRTTMLYLVAAGQGVTFLPGSLATISTPGVVMRPFAAEPMTIAAAYRADPPGLAMQFLRIAQDALKGDAEA